MFIRVRQKFSREDGASAVEYAILIAAIAAIIVAIVFVLGGRVKSAFSKTNSCISVSGQASACGGAQASQGDDDDEEEEEDDCTWRFRNGRWVCS